VCLPFFAITLNGAFFLTPYYTLGLSYHIIYEVYTYLSGVHMLYVCLLRVELNKLRNKNSIHSLQHSIHVCSYYIVLCVYITVDPDVESMLRERWRAIETRSGRSATSNLLNSFEVF